MNQGVRLLGTPLGHPDFVRAQLASLSTVHDQLLQQVPTIPDLQCAWMMLLYCCAGRANYTLRVVHPELSATFVATMMVHFVDASADFLGLTQVQCVGISRVFLCHWEVWGCAAQL